MILEGLTEGKPISDPKILFQNVLEFTFSSQMLYEPIQPSRLMDDTVGCKLTNKTHSFLRNIFIPTVFATDRINLLFFCFV